VEGRELEQARHLELALVRLRWAVAAFGVFQVVFALRESTDAPEFALPLGVALVAGLIAGNLTITSAADGAERIEQLRWVGGMAFALDGIVLLGLIWVSSSSPGDPTWVIGYLLPLEGAARYGLPGAVAAAIMFGVADVGREAFLTERLTSHVFDSPALGFRAGMALVVAVVSGAFAEMARRETRRAEERAVAAEEAAARADAAASREAEARSEVLAFHAAILADTADDDLAQSLQRMAEAIGRELGADGFAVLLRSEGLAGETVLIAAGVHGDPGYAAGDRLSGLHDPVGRAVGEARPMQLGNDVAVPMRVRDDVIGALHQRSAAGELDHERLLLLGRLADQIALIVQSARLRAKQEETLQRLRELDLMKSDFVAITSHELRTPLAAIRGFVDMLRRRGSELSAEETEEFLGIISIQTDRLVRLVEDLLVVSKIEAGKLTLEPEEVATQSLVEQVVQGLGDGGGRVRPELGPTAPDRLVVDPQRLMQVLTNLLQNALKYSPAELPVVLAVASGAEGTVTFGVRDGGPGIAPDELERIFERFHQTESAQTRRSEGFGLGLYITKRLVEAMGGWISVDSEVGRGSTFAVTLPAVRTLPAPATPSAATRPDRTAS
jgi:signal transduction histidine kinase